MMSFTRNPPVDLNGYSDWVWVDLSNGMTLRARYVDRSDFLGYEDKTAHWEVDIFGICPEYVDENLLIEYRTEEILRWCYPPEHEEG